ncbi:hypothetical protein [Paracidovorax wautersii]|uniref:DUF2946 domain-containing protein n=1 Tax=Paracidovorax wautersii TaxID=1177982 RepID=A0A1I2B792_9BURK|nr:hypothetical protein [Paracidovorax wautersii]SFE51020.1 hypothetical protein SAMN04489711_102409 [Paracidovorax wautersii]
MFRRLVIVFMLLLLPLQWAAAQAHESGASVESVADEEDAAPAQPVAGVPAGGHTQEHGGEPCLFHTLAQASALAGLHEAPLPATPGRFDWIVPPDMNHHGTGAANDIDRPRWPGRAPSTADRPART